MEMMVGEDVEGDVDVVMVNADVDAEEGTAEGAADGVTVEDAAEVVAAEVVSKLEAVRAAELTLPADPRAPEDEAVGRAAGAEKASAVAAGAVDAGSPSAWGRARRDAPPLSARGGDR